MTEPGSARNRLHRVLAWTTHQLGGLLPGAKARRVQVAAFEREWDVANAAALAASGPLWVVLGDSTAQAIGASDREHGYALRVLDVLRRTDPSWRLVNLSRTGARVADVLRSQVPALGRLPEPGLVSVAIGVNDLRHRTPDLPAMVRSLLDAVPAGTVVATVPQGLRPGAARELNELIRREVAARGLRLADVWARTGPPWHAKFSADHFHPNDLGYADWAAAFLAALGEPVPAATAAAPLPGDAVAPAGRSTRLDQLRCLGRRLGVGRARSGDGGPGRPA